MKRKIKKEYVIFDWAGNHLFQGETFTDVDDAFGRIIQYLEEQGMSDEEIDETLDEYYVDKIEPKESV